MASFDGALEVLPPERDEFRRAALVRYLEYLRSRQEALREAYVQQRHRDGTPSLADPRENTASQAMRETSIFDVEDIPSTVAEEDGYATLRRGETVKVPIPSQPMEILMSRHKFVLEMDGDLVLRDDEGKRFALKHGRNVVGRDLANEVVLDAGYRDISRCHLVIDTSAPALVATDRYVFTWNPGRIRKLSPRSPLKFRRFGWATHKICDELREVNQMSRRCGVS